MNQTFPDFATNQRADRDTIQQATIYYMAERTEDMTPEQMLEQMREGVNDINGLYELLRHLECNTEALDNVCLTLLSSAWEESGELARIEGAVVDAKKQLPVIEVGIVAIAAVYGMYLLVTRGIRKRERMTVRKEDGTVIEREVTEYAGPGEPLRSIVSLFQPLPKDSGQS